jgi:hypothetical protein
LVAAEHFFNASRAQILTTGPADTCFECTQSRFLHASHGMLCTSLRARECTRCCCHGSPHCGDIKHRPPIACHLQESLHHSRTSPRVRQMANSIPLPKRIGFFPVRGDIPGSRSRDIGYEFVDFRRPDLGNRQWVRTCASGTGVRAKHRRSGDPGLWVRNKEQWADRRVMTANTRVRRPRRVSRSE